MTSKSHLERILYQKIQDAGLPLPQQQYRLFAEMVGPGRGLRKRLEAAGYRDFVFDFAWPNERLLVEVQGGTWMGGAHVRGEGYRDDCEKGNAAQLLGWCVLHFTTGMIGDGTAMQTLEKALKL